MKVTTAVRALVVLTFSIALGIGAHAAPGDGGGNAPISLTLKNDFIAKYKNRATITDVIFQVDQVHTAPNPGSKDGDLHVAGRTDAVGLPMVAELMNAKMKKPLVTMFNSQQKSAGTVTLSGVWRLWAEHGGLDPQVQGDPVEPATTTNPQHLFEMHPMTSVNGQSVLDTFEAIPGFTYKVAADAFQRYEGISFHLECAEKTTTLRTKMIGYNYVDFDIALIEDPTHAVEDGVSIFADIYDADGGDLLVHKRRIWFVKDSDPYQEVMALHTGQHLHVLGIPRISMSLLAWRCKEVKDHPKDPRGVLDWNLPYEMVVVATL